MDRFDHEVEHLLRASGWFPGRVAEVKPCLSAWTSLGLDAELGPVSFVREFDGLLVRHPPVVEVAGVEHPDFTRFDVVRAVQGISPRAYREYSRIADVNLFPIGENRSHMTLMATANGRLFSGVDNFLFVYPGNLDSVLSEIVCGLSPDLVGEWSL